MKTLGKVFDIKVSLHRTFFDNCNNIVKNFVGSGTVSQFEQVSTHDINYLFGGWKYFTQRVWNDL